MKMKRFFGKKTVLLSALVLALGVAVYLNYYFSSGIPGTDIFRKKESSIGEAQYVNAEVSDGDLSANYFDQARYTRTKAREEALGIVKETMVNVKASAEDKSGAAATIEMIAQQVAQEDSIESLIKAKGFVDCLVYIEDEQCHVVVEGDQLTEPQVAQITEIVIGQSGIPAQNLKISSIKS